MTLKGRAIVLSVLATMINSNPSATHSLTLLPNNHLHHAAEDAIVLAANKSPKVVRNCFYDSGGKIPKEVGCSCGSPVLKLTCDQYHNCVRQNIEPKNCMGGATR